MFLSIPNLLNSFQSVLPFTSIRKPIKFTAIGNDGRPYHFIAKYGEDLRQARQVPFEFGGIFEKWFPTRLQKVPIELTQRALCRM